MKALPLSRNKNIDFILAVGGGSVIDGKFISAVHLEINGNSSKDC
jgi:alcohol dehydrogenase YqhD (iron-dependent ADH family)